MCKWKNEERNKVWEHGSPSMLDWGPKFNSQHHKKQPKPWGMNSGSPKQIPLDKERAILKFSDKKHENVG